MGLFDETSATHVEPLGVAKPQCTQVNRITDALDQVFRLIRAN
jgi:hypothetical protein